MLRLCIRSNDVFNEGDALDYSHAVTSFAYCDVSVLDKKWARRCRSLNDKINPLIDTAIVYDVTEIDRLIAALEAWK